ncbi:MAG: DUF1244 domain-containing protein [Cocleimonas sp.]|nr:DUF1244 domain-containing protein [Cocleimonas sp.]
MDKKTQTEMEAAAFRDLIKHLQRRTDAQNIDIMNLAGFCRNCLSKWYRNAGLERGEAISYAEAQHVIYGMSIEEWKEKHQGKATEAQLKTFEDTKPLHAYVSGHQK